MNNLITSEGQMFSEIIVKIIVILNLVLTKVNNRYKIIVRKGQKVKEGKKMNLVDMIENYLREEVEKCNNDIL